MAKGSSKLSTSGKSTSNTPRTSDIAENLKPGDIIKPQSGEKWTYHIGSEPIRSEMLTYVTVDSIKVGPKTVTITGHYDHSGYFSKGSEAWKKGKTQFTTVTKSVKLGTMFNLK